MILERARAVFHYVSTGERAQQLAFELQAAFKRREGARREGPGPRAPAQHILCGSLCGKGCLLHVASICSISLHYRY